MQTVRLLNIWTGIRSNLIARRLIWYKLKEETLKFNYTYQKKKQFLLYYSVSVTKTIDDGSKQAYHIGAFYAGCLFPRGATANTGVGIYFYIFLYKYNLNFLK